MAIERVAELSDVLWASAKHSALGGKFDYDPKYAFAATKSEPAKKTGENSCRVASAISGRVWKGLPIDGTSVGAPARLRWTGRFLFQCFEELRSCLVHEFGDVHHSDLVLHVLGFHPV